MNKERYEDGKDFEELPFYQKPVYALLGAPVCKDCGKRMMSEVTIMGRTLQDNPQVDKVVGMSSFLALIGLGTMATGAYLSVDSPHYISLITSGGVMAGLGVLGVSTGVISHLLLTRPEAFHKADTVKKCYNCLRRERDQYVFEESMKNSEEEVRLEDHLPPQP